MQPHMLIGVRVVGGHRVKGSQLDMAEWAKMRTVCTLNVNPINYYNITSQLSDKLAACLVLPQAVKDYSYMYTHSYPTDDHSIRNKSQ